MALIQDEKTIAATTAMQRALEMSPAEFATLGLRAKTTAASDAETVDMDFIETAVRLSKRSEMRGPKGEEFNVGRLSKIIFKMELRGEDGKLLFPTIPSAHSKLMSAARWLKNNRSYTMPVKEGADRTTIAYPPAPAATA